MFTVPTAQFPDTRKQYDMLIFDVYTDGEVRQNNETYSYSYGIWLKYASKFIQNYWWLRSPDTSFFGGDNYVYRVDPSGDVDDDYEGALYSNIGNSYGRNLIT